MAQGSPVTDTYDPGDDEDVIPGAGPRDSQGRPEHCDGMLVGEAGGATEHKRKRPFCGKTGDVMTAYLRAAGVARPDIFITNTFPFWTGEGNPDPTPAQVQREEWRLRQDLRWVRPRVIGTVGRVATQWFLGESADMETTHGIPHYSDKAPGSVVVAIYHPAAGFYDPDAAAWSQDDFIRFAYYLRNPFEARTAPEVKFVYVDEAPDVIADAAVDTEGLEDRPWGMSWSFDGVTTYVWIWARGKKLPKLRGRITYQNALHDLPILRAMGIDTTEITFDDTMVALYNLQLEPQGLKPAAFRFLGLKMSSFEDVVRPHFDHVTVRYLRRALCWEYPKPVPMPVKDLAKRKFRVYKPQGPTQRILNILRSYRKNSAKTKLEKRWSKIGENAFDDRTEQYQAAIERRAGPFPEFSIHLVPHDEAVAYSGMDAAATNLLKSRVLEMVKARGLAGVYEMDRRALPFVDRMKEVGMRVNVPKLREFEAELETIHAQRLKHVQSIVGDRFFNPGSSDQVRRWLFHVKGLPVLTWTDTKLPSTKDSALKMLRGYHSEDEDVAEFLDAIQAYREADKYLGTYVRPIFAVLRRDSHGHWRVHANFRVTRVVSGRLSSHDPNVLAIPIRTALGKKLRYCFEAEEGWVLVDADLSQLELRVGAHYSRDRRMRQAFEHDEDLHALTASIIFKLALELFAKPRSEEQEAQRYIAKTINFAVFYGITARALLEQLYQADIFRYTVEDCERFIIEWFRIYASVQAYQKRLWAQAAKDGFVRTMFGRMCYVPNLRVMDDDMRMAAERLCGNFPIQGTGSDVVKRAEIRLYDYICDQGLRDSVRPWLQMHDELLLEAPKELAPEVAKLLTTVMTADRRRFSVPLKAEAKIGQSWGDAK